MSRRAALAVLALLVAVACNGRPAAPTAKAPKPAKSYDFEQDTPGWRRLSAFVSSSPVATHNYR